MRAVAIIFILLSVSANFYYDNPSSLVLAMLSFPVLLWLLLTKRKRNLPPNAEPPVNHPKTTDISFDSMEEDKAR